MVVIALLAGCGPKVAPAVAARHPLAGRIWDVDRKRWSDEDGLLADMEDVDFVLLGENHDNAEHHRLQARLISEIEPLSVGFEMLDHGDRIDATDALALARDVDWGNSGWPSFSLYAPVFEAAFAIDARIVAAHPTREEVEQVMSGGVEALSAEATAGLALDRPLPPAERAALVSELGSSHGGDVSADVVERMVRAQVLKDMWMARAMAIAARPGILIAGGGHTRRDRGVPLYLEGDVRVVRFVEAVDGETDPRTYDEGADWLWFTGRADR